MRAITAFLLVAVIALAACGDAGGDAPPATEPPATEPPATTGPAAPGDDVPLLMALALRQLVTVDTTFGPGHRFTTLLVQTETDPAAGRVTQGESRPLTDAERVAIEAELAGISELRWIDDPDEWRTDDLRPTIDGAAIVGVGEPTFDDDGALVPVSLWCGGLCGTWFDYRLSIDDGAWTVVGPEGPVAIS